MTKSSKSKKRAKSNRPVTVAREVMSEAEAARACASMFVRLGIPEGSYPGEFEIVDVSFDDDGQYFATIKVPVSDLDIEMATSGHHMDQDKINEIRAEQAESK